MARHQLEQHPWTSIGSLTKVRECSTRWSPRCAGSIARSQPAGRRARRSLPGTRPRAGGGEAAVGDRTEGLRAADSAGAARARLRLREPTRAVAPRCGARDGHRQRLRPPQPSPPAHPGRASGAPGARPTQRRPRLVAAGAAPSTAEQQARYGDAHGAAAAPRWRPRDHCDGSDSSRCAPMPRRLLRRARPPVGAGFDPDAGISAEPAELRPPAGVLLLAYLHGQPVGCGALKNHRDAVSEIKRMWVADSARGLGIGRRLLESWRHSIEVRDAHRPPRDEPQPQRGDSDVPRGRLPEVPPFNDEPFADHWFEKHL